ncbi:hypothetical protein NE619_08525 [Anaerovorax odorimutans]|uniref:Uncharacterized protein n=1 Tax=Anaerovorax odorimutans TaxID=109327 RepID=A0ABT1RNN2_9FIRM|nr:hypothetical protein [Anaerovorax odorimutans]
MKKNLIVIVLVVLVIGTIGTAAYLQFVKPDEASKVVSKPYEGEQTAGFETLLNSSNNFDLGVNKYGQPIFIDRDKAYEQMLITCNDGIEAIKKTGDLPKISKQNMDAYGSIGAELSESDFSRDVLKQAAFIGVFYDFYCHSDDDFYINRAEGGD